jgi:hypothetical protein
MLTIPKRTLMASGLLSQSHLSRCTLEVPCVSSALALVSDDEVPIPLAMLSCVPSAFRPFVRPQPAPRLVAVADTLLGMVNIDLLLLLLHNPQFPDKAHRAPRSETSCTFILKSPHDAHTMACAAHLFAMALRRQAIPQTSML